MGADADVVVVGAGLAGLSAAARLRAAGRAPVVLEAEGQVGGRQRSVQLAGCTVEEGALFFGRNYPVLWGHLRGLGLEPELKRYDLQAPPLPLPEAIPRDPVRLLRDARVPLRRRIGAAAFLASLLPHAREIRASLGVPFRSRRLRRLDALDADRHLARGIGRELLEFMASPFLESLSFAPARAWSAAGALQILAFAFLRDLFGVRGGNARIARGLAAGLDVQLGARVLRLATSAAGGEVELEVGGAVDTLRCRDVVLAVPAPAAVPLLPPALAEAAAGFPYSASIVVANVVRSLDLPLPSVSGLGGPDGRGGVRALSLEQQEPGGPVLCFGTLCHPRHDELFDAADERIARMQLEIVEEVAGRSVELLASRVIRWRHSIPVGGPGTLARRRELERLARDAPHLALAGDWLLSPSQEGALVSGLRAAERLLARAS
jgi:oxygen-dependent protoporphyrinogen oxidase